ncbi:YidB family protein [Rugamonas sp. DEMB1]|uniref:YidB family protein n=1 Tax=Rugamonas sp. DEMB1 TaxID=3039386 RepID=UPI0024475F86|nr:YidB family protein [Rugamonas sp. DEMB1]WGG51584.1 YidB family protein [Rugamonas sp. DEMB1]
MGILDQLAGQVMGSLGAQQQDPVPQGELLNGVMAMLNNAGGLSGLVQKLQASGLGDQVASWIGTGDNHTVSGNQIADALGGEHIAQLAQQAGLEPEHAATGLAQLLPQIIDSLTPNGQIPEDGALDQALDFLKGKLFG